MSTMGKAYGSTHLHAEVSLAIWGFLLVWLGFLVCLGFF